MLKTAGSKKQALTPNAAGVALSGRIMPLAMLFYYFLGWRILSYGNYCY